MGVQEDVPFDPGVGAVQVEQIIVGAHEHVVIKLNDGPGPVATGEVAGVVVTLHATPEVAAEDGTSTGLDTLAAVHRFKAPGRGGEEAVLHYKRATVQGKIRAAGIAESEMVKKQIRASAVQ